MCHSLDLIIERVKVSLPSPADIASPCSWAIALRTFSALETCRMTRSAWQVASMVSLSHLDVGDSLRGDEVNCLRLELLEESPEQSLYLLVVLLRQPLDEYGPNLPVELSAATR